MSLKDFAFNVLKTDNYARTGLIKTHRGNIQTPAFMPVGTQATVKACKIDDIKNQAGIKINLDENMSFSPYVEIIADKDMKQQSAMIGTALSFTF